MEVFTSVLFGWENGAMKTETKWLLSRGSLWSMKIKKTLGLSTRLTCLEGVCFTPEQVCSKKLLVRWRVHISTIWPTQTCDSLTRTTTKMDSGTLLTMYALRPLISRTLQLSFSRLSLRKVRFQTNGVVLVNENSWKVGAWPTTQTPSTILHRALGFNLHSAKVSLSQVLCNWFI